MIWLQIIAEHTPMWVWLCLALLLFLGVRRLKPRRTHLAVAALAPVGFILLSVTTAAPFIFNGDELAPVLLWGAAIVGGACTVRLRSVERPVHVGGWFFDFAPSLAPMAIYLLLFSMHYGLEIWAGFDPSVSASLALLRLVLSAATAGRTAADFIGLLCAVQRDIKSADGCACRQGGGAR